MSTRISKILERARTTLADRAAERWTDSDLLALLDEGQKDICRQTKILKGISYIKLEVGVEYFTLPDTCWLLKRVEYRGLPLDFVTSTQLDNYPGNNVFNNTSDWLSDVGSPEAIVYDGNNLLQARVYPIPDESIFESSYPFSGGADYAGGEVFGVVTNISDYTFTSAFGVVTDMYEPGIEEIINSPFGVVTDVTETKDLLKCFYVANPSDVVSVDSTLDIPYMFDTALKYYVVGQAFLNDIDVAYQEKGSQQLAFYNRDLDVIKATSKSNGISAPVNKTEYRGL